MAAQSAARGTGLRLNGKAVVMTLYLVFLLLPIYWLLNMSLKTNSEILNVFSLWPRDLTFANYRTILTDPSWYMGYVNSLTYVVMNTVISLTVALPAAYAFSRYSFMGDKHLFFWLLTNRMAPPAVFALPFFQLYSSVGLFDTHIAVALAHCLFNVPLAVWILEGFMRGVPKEIDETAYIDGYGFGRFFIRIFMPLIASGTATAANFSFYKLEINGPQTDNTWASLLGRTISQPVFAGLLGSGNFNGWLPGAYRVRLIVVDATGNEQGSCTVDININ